MWLRKHKSVPIAECFIRGRVLFARIGLSLLLGSAVWLETCNQTQTLASGAGPFVAPTIFVF